MTLKKFFDWLIEYSFYSLFFLVPLVMTPWNFELFEYNKMMITYAFTAIIVGTWIAKMVIEKKFLFRHSPFEIPIIIFLVSQFLSFLFSIDKHTSFWGYYSRFHGGLLSTITYTLLYFAFISNFDRQKVLNLLRYTLISALIVSFYGVLEHLGIDAKYWVQDVQNRVFSTMGQPNWLAAYLAVIVPLSFSYTILSITTTSKSLTNFKFLLYLTLTLLFAMCLVFTKSRSGIPAAIIALLIFSFFLILPKIFSLKKHYAGITIFFLTTILIVGSLAGFKTLFSNAKEDLLYIFGITSEVKITMQLPHDARGSSSRDIRKVVWHGAVDIFKHYPVFGSGVETFAYSYYNFKPAQHNLLSEWDFLYNKAHNEYFNFLATTGVIGTGAYLLFIGWVIGWSIKKISNFKFLISKEIPNSKFQKDLGQSEQLEIRLINIAIFSGWLSTLVTNFFGFSVVIVALFFFLFPAISYILLQEEVQPTTYNKQPVYHLYKLHPFQYIILVILLSSILYLLSFLYTNWSADVAYAKGNRLNKQGFYEQAFNSLQEAIQQNDREPVYKDEIAWNAANLAVLLAEQKQTNLAENLGNLAIFSSDKALASSPRNTIFLKNRAKIFFKLSQLNTSLVQNGLDVLLENWKLAPTDAKIAYNIGLVYSSLNQDQKAIEFLEEARRVKMNYFDARSALAQLYLKNKQTQKAIKEYEDLSDMGYEDARFPLAQAYFGNGQKQKAIEQLEILKTGSGYSPGDQLDQQYAEWTEKK